MNAIKALQSMYPEYLSHSDAYFQMLVNSLATRWNFWMRTANFWFRFFCFLAGLNDKETGSHQLQAMLGSQIYFKIQTRLLLSAAISILNQTLELTEMLLSNARCLNWPFFSAAVDLDYRYKIAPTLPNNSPLATCETLKQSSPAAQTFPLCSRTAAVVRLPPVTNNSPFVLLKQP